MPQIEQRQMGEIRAEDSGKLIGYAAVFNSRSNDLGGFYEVIEPGAFSGSLDSDVRALWNHDSNIVLGRTTTGTLQVSEDEHGLRVEITPPDTGMMRDYMESVKRGDVSQMSFAFSVADGGQRFEELEDGQVLRTLNNLTLYEVSPVTFPAYPDTTVAARAIDKLKESKNFAGLRAKMKRGLHDKIYRS